jgi:16S rRNA (uracil1498-N3)-methyltransferase
MPPRLYVDQAIRTGGALALPATAVRHAQVLRLQPGAAVTLFNGQGGEWAATVLSMSRSGVSVQVTAHDTVERELAVPVTLALGMPANERMDALVEKATELGVAVIQPLLCQHSVLRLHGERADKRIAHWQGVAIAACEQSGRTRVPRIEPVVSLAFWLQALPARADESRLLLSLRHVPKLPLASMTMASALCLSGPEGGLTDAEEAAARAHGFISVWLGPRALRADTAPLALLAHLALGSEATR